MNDPRRNCLIAGSVHFAAGVLAAALLPSMPAFGVTFAALGVVQLLLASFAGDARLGRMQGRLFPDLVGSWRTLREK